MLIIKTHIQLPPRAHRIPDWFGVEGTLRIIQDTSNHPRLLQPWPTWPWTLWDHIYLTKCEELSQKKTKKNEAAARSQLVTVTKWTLFPKNPPDFEFAAFHSLTPTPQEQQLLQHSYKNTRAEFQPKTRNGFNPEKLLFFTFFFFFPRYSLTFAEKCLEVCLSFRSCIRHKNIDASVQRSIREWSMLSGPWTKLPCHCSRKCSFALTDG